MLTQKLGESVEAVGPISEAAGLKDPRYAPHPEILVNRRYAPQAYALKLERGVLEDSRRRRAARPALRRRERR